MQSIAEQPGDDSAAVQRHAAVLDSMIRRIELKSQQPDVAEKVQDALVALAQDLSVLRKDLVEQTTDDCPPELVDLGRDLLVALSLLRPALAASTPAEDLNALHTSMKDVWQRADRIACRASLSLSLRTGNFRMIQLVELIRANIAACDYVLELALDSRVA